MLVLAFLIAIGGSVLLYVLVRQEHGRRETMDRKSAELAARKDRRHGGGEGQVQGQPQARRRGEEQKDSRGASTEGRE